MKSITMTFTLTDEAYGKIVNQCEQIPIGDFRVSDSNTDGMKLFIARANEEEYSPYADPDALAGNEMVVDIDDVFDDETTGVGIPACMLRKNLLDALRKVMKIIDDVRALPEFSPVDAQWKLNSLHLYLGSVHGLVRMDQRD